MSVHRRHWSADRPRTRRPALAAGTHPVIATYSGDASYLPSSGSLNQVVSQGASSIVVTSSSQSVELHEHRASSPLRSARLPQPARSSSSTGLQASAAARSAAVLLPPRSPHSVDRHAQYHSCLQRRRYLPAEHKCGDRPGRPGPYPAAPSNLVATAVSSTQINLTWTDNATNETGFTIQRATNSAFTSGLNTINLGANQTAYNNTGRNPSTTYYYRVRAFNVVGFSAWSNIAFAFTAIGGSPAAPSNLVATALSPTQISLTWTDNAIDETGFTVQRATNADFTGAPTSP